MSQNLNDFTPEELDAADMVEEYWGPEVLDDYLRMLREDPEREKAPTPEEGENSR